MDESKMQDSISTQGNVSQKKVILAGTVGNAIEWFDWTIYATFAVFSRNNFSHQMIQPHPCLRPSQFLL